MNSGFRKYIEKFKANEMIKFESNEKIEKIDWPIDTKSDNNILRRRNKEQFSRKETLESLLVIAERKQPDSINTVNDICQKIENWKNVCYEVCFVTIKKDLNSTIMPHFFLEIL